MKKLLLSSFACLALVHGAIADTKIPTVDITGEITTDMHLTTDKQYLLKGWVYVTSGKTLTIDPGVIIKGDRNTKGALIIEKGAKIMAQGSATAPIVFTSNELPGDRTYGDWGGVIICGTAPTNWTAGEAQVEGGPRSKYGGTDPHDNSGVLSYVRIEFAGIAFSPNNEVNGLSLYGVGDGTKLDHIQVSYSGDDAIEWFGGTVNAKNLVSFRTWDDDFDTDVMYRGKNQFVVALRDPYSADQSGSKVFESDGYKTSATATGLGGDTTKLTRPVFSNCTIIGPMVNANGASTIDNQYIAGAHIRLGSAMSLLNSVLGGFPTGILIDDNTAVGSTVGNIVNDALQIRNNIIAGNTPGKDIFHVKNGGSNMTSTSTWGDTTTPSYAPYSGPIGFLTAPANRNYLYASFTNGVRLQNPFDLTNPNFLPTSTSPIAYNSKALPGYMTDTTGGRPADPFANGKLYPYDPTKPLNEDTTNRFANYNAPTAAPNFTTTKANDAFFDKVSYVGAFSIAETFANNWMSGWTNFDPVNANYDVFSTGVNEVASKSFQSVIVYPNPAGTRAAVGVEMKKDGNLKITLVDITGKIVKEIFNGNAAVGNQVYPVDLSDVTAGLYMVSINTVDAQRTVKLSVVK